MKIPRTKKFDLRFVGWLLVLGLPLCAVGGSACGCRLWRTLRRERRARETERRNAEIAMHQAKGRDEFLAFICHEVRNPLNGCVCAVELMRPLASKIPQMQDLVDTLTACHNVMRTILDDTLDLRKVEQGLVVLDSVPFDPAQVARSIAACVSVRVGTDFRIDIDPAVPGCVLGDPVRVRQVLLNLTSNALKFTKEGYVTLGIQRVYSNTPSRLSLRDSLPPPEDSPGHVHNLATAGMCHLRFYVRDTGIGIKEQALSELFRPFRQAASSIHRQFGGSGLGLKISKGLIEQMKGNIFVISEVGVGTVMEFVLPFPLSNQVPELSWTPQAPIAHLTEEIGSGSDRDDYRTKLDPLPKSSSAENPPEPPVTPSLTTPDENIFLFGPADEGKGTKRAKKHKEAKRAPQEQILVLLVEDNTINRKLGARLLQTSGFTVIVAQDGAEGVEKVEKYRPDVIIMDVEMPIMDGQEATIVLRKKGCTCPIIGLTGNVLSEQQARYLAAGMNLIHSKPMDVVRLSNDIRATYEQSKRDNARSEEGFSNAIDIIS